MWTASDYTVLLRGLRHGLDASAPSHERVTAAQLTRMISNDLQDAGFKKGSIHAIEVGRRCRQEVKLMRELEKANIKRHELAARKQYYQSMLKSLSRSSAAAPGAAPSSPKSEHERQKRLADAQKELDEDEDDQIELNATMSTIVVELERLYTEPDYATGHAFITFNYEKDKLRFLQRYNDQHAPAVKKGGLSSVLSALRGRFGSRPPKVKPSAEKSAEPPLIKRAARPGKSFEADGSAPEPSEVNWEALELDDAHERRALLWGWLGVSIQLIGSTVLLISIRYLRQVQAEGGLIEGEAANPVNYSLMLAYSLATAVTNFLLKVSIEWLTDREGQDTKTEFEASLFVKLALAYVINSAAIPVLLGFFFSGLPPQNEPIDQSWYERSGVVGQVWLLLIINAFTKEIPKVVPIGPIIQRHILPMFGWAHSHAMLRKLWMPPAMRVGELYANTLKVCALAMITGPLYPICYLWGALGMVVCNLCTAFGISRWYARPPAVDVAMMMTLRKVLSLILLCQIGVSMGAAETLGFRFGSERETYGAQWVVYVAAPSLWLLYALVPLEWVAPKYFQRTDSAEATEALSGDTEGLHVDTIIKVKGYEIDPYICPRITERVYQVTKQATKIMQRAANARSIAKVGRIAKLGAKGGKGKQAGPK